MATSTKTLTPTNQTITIPDMTERPNASVLTDGIGKEADAINALNSNLAVKTGTFTADSTNHPNGDPHFTVKQYGKVVSINGYMRSLGSFNADTNFRLGTISGVSMPPTDVRGIATIASQAYLNGSYNYLSINPSTGDVNINPREATNGKAVYFTICYVTD